jgi:WD40 repeat protein
MRRVVVSIVLLGLAPAIARAGSPAQGAAAGRAKRGEPARSAGFVAEEQRRYAVHSGAVTDLAVSRDGRYVVSSSLDQTIRYWDLQTGKTIQTLKGHTGPVICVDISPDGKRAVSGGADQAVRIWDLTAGTELRRLDGHGGGVLEVAFSPDGRRILSAGCGSYHAEKLWDISTVWRPESDFAVRVWDAGTGKEIHRLAGHTSMVWSLAFSWDGSRAVSAGDDATVRLWDLHSGRELACDRRHTARVFCAGFASSGKDMVVSAGQDGLIWIRSLPAGRDERSIQFEKNFNIAHHGAFAPDGRRALIAMASWMPEQGGYIYLWDLNKGKAEAGLQWGSGGNTRGTFFADGSRVLWGSADGLIHLFRVPR